MAMDAPPQLQHVSSWVERTYTFDNGWTAKREGDLGRWVLRNALGELVDSDPFRLVLFLRHKLDVK